MQRDELIKLAFLHDRVAQIYMKDVLLCELSPSHSSRLFCGFFESLTEHLVRSGLRTPASSCLINTFKQR